LYSHVNIIGGGLAGCEAAHQIAKLGVPVKLYEMKPVKFSPAHTNGSLAELVCSNSLKALNIENASGLLKEEMRHCESIILHCADLCAVPAGGALAVDRNNFSEMVTSELEKNSLITIIRREITSINEINDGNPIVIASGPLTSDDLAKDIIEQCNIKALNFFDAAAPVIYKESIDMSKAFFAARYGKGTDDYINCPMNREEYQNFYTELINADTAQVESFDELHLYEGCMPVESMARRGFDTLTFGPLKPVGLVNPADNKKNFAVVQLRQDNNEGTLYNMVGFQTRLKFAEQKRVFGLIPGLLNAEFARYGVMHRNTYINSPGYLEETYRVSKGTDTIKDLFFAGQITGVEGYIESASSGLIAGINAAMTVLKKDKIIFPPCTAMGSLAFYVSKFPGKDFQPMGANFGIINSEQIELPTKKKDKAAKRAMISQNALSAIDLIIKNKESVL